MSCYQINQKKEVISNTYTIDAVRITLGEVILSTSAVVFCDFLNNNGSIVKTTMDKLEGADYSNWGANDAYVVDWICRKYAIVKK